MATDSQKEGIKEGALAGGLITAFRSSNNTEWLLALV